MNVASRKKDNLEITMSTDFPVLIEASGALRTAQHADAYANQLRDEFNALLFAAIARTISMSLVALPVCSMSFAL